MTVRDAIKKLLEMPMESTLLVDANLGEYTSLPIDEIYENDKDNVVIIAGGRGH